MAVFETVEQVEQIQGRFLRELMAEPEVWGKLSSSNMCFVMHYSEPTCDVFIDCRGEAATVAVSPDRHEADIELTLTADIGHEMWLGKVNLVTAMASRKIKTKGNVARFAGMVPLMTIGMPRYRKYCEALESGQ
jgi:putative sterol carrier protein